MVAFSRLLIALSSLAGALAAPTCASDERSVDLTERGPHDFFLGPDSTSLRRRSAINYNQDYTTGGTVDYSPSSTGFSVTWNTEDDFVVGVGWQTGSTSPITFGGSFSVSGGTGLLSVYGWTTNPLVEYYIMENYSEPPQSGTIKGTFTSDGSTYTIWENQRVNEPSIEGTSTFNQYISIRNTPRSSGTVTVENHFTEWASLGLDMGSFNYQVIAVEGWGGSGSSDQTVSNSGSSTSTGGTGGSGGSGSSGTCSALWGQCGGEGWSGPTCCSSGTCQESNAWYSQCLE